MSDRNNTIIVNAGIELGVKGVTLASKAAYRKLSKKSATIIIHQPIAG